jgi:hypothetical protein
MEHARGTQLGDMWRDMEIDQKTAIVDQVVAIESIDVNNFILMVR